MARTDDLLPEHIRMTAMEWRILINNEVVDEADRIAFEEWRKADPRHADAYDRAVTLWSAYGTLKKREMNPKLFRGRFRYWLRSWLPAPLFEGSSPRARLAGAAGALAVLGIATFSAMQLFGTAPAIEEPAPVLTAYKTETGELRDVTLTDRSSITLGPGSEIQVAMTSEERRVELIRGAAVFNVSSNPDRPFYVEAQDFSVRVLGTVFDVRNNGGIVRLSVSEGLVEASHPIIINDELSTMVSRKQLGEGQSITASASRGLSRVTDFDSGAFASWRDSRLKYEDAPLSELVADANRYSKIPITLEGSLERDASLKATFSYDAGNTDKMLSALPALFPVEIDRSSGAEIIIRNAAD
ncbi:MAG: FecR domain-containing protein [Pseudomonadota bacterium]